MAQPTNTQHTPSPNISGGANDINLPENSKVSGGNSNIYLNSPSSVGGGANDILQKENPKIAGGANDIYLPENQATKGSGIYLQDNKPVQIIKVSWLWLRVRKL